MHISGFFIWFSLTLFPPPPAESSPLLPGLTKANCHGAIWATQRLSEVWEDKGPGWRSPPTQDCF